MKIRLLNVYFLTWLFGLSAVFSGLNAQILPDKPLPQSNRYECRNSGSYNVEPPILKGYGVKFKPWYQKLFPFLWKNSNDLKIPTTDFERIYARPLAVGESERSKEIRANARKKLLEIQQLAEQKWQKWQTENPAAEPDEIKAAEEWIRFRGLAQAQLPQFDWSKNGIDVGRAGFQGYECNTCWAFATLDAMQFSRQLVALRSQTLKFDPNSEASVLQFVRCLVPD